MTINLIKFEDQMIYWEALKTPEFNSISIGGWENKLMFSDKLMDPS